MKPAQRMAAIPSFLVLDMLRDAGKREARGENILHLAAGQPCFRPPQAVLDAVAESLKNNSFAYTEAKGLLALRHGIAEHYADFYNTSIEAERIIITPGSSGAFILSFLAAFDVGAKVGITVPGYPAYKNILLALGITPVPIPVTAEEGYRLSVAHLEKLPEKLDGLIVASPANPTGTMLAPEQLKAIAEYCQTHQIRLISDELYHGVSYGQQQESTALAFNKEAVVINSFSKYYAMTGWRLGWVVAPAGLVESMEALAQSLFIAAPTISQIGGITALSCRQVLDGYVAEYAENREILLQGLQRLGFTDISPADGAFYVYASIAPFAKDSLGFCQKLLEQTGIAATAGVDFDENRGHQTIRFSFAAHKSAIEEALLRLEKWL